jgi:hypothetical protein
LLSLSTADVAQPDAAEQHIAGMTDTYAIDEHRGGST